MNLISYVSLGNVINLSGIVGGIEVVKELKCKIIEEEELKGIIVEEEELIGVLNDE